MIISFHTGKAWILYVAVLFHLIISVWVACLASSSAFSLRASPAWALTLLNRRSMFLFLIVFIIMDHNDQFFSFSHLLCVCLGLGLFNLLYVSMQA